MGRFRSLHHTNLCQKSQYDSSQKQNNSAALEGSIVHTESAESERSLKLLQYETIRDETRNEAQMKFNSKPTSNQTRPSPLPAGGSIKGSMKTEEPLGWDQAPQSISDPEMKRHPRPDGAGGIVPAEDKEKNISEAEKKKG